MEVHVWGGWTQLQISVKWKQLVMSRTHERVLCWLHANGCEKILGMWGAFFQHFFPLSDVGKTIGLSMESYCFPVARSSAGMHSFTDSGQWLPTHAWSVHTSKKALHVRGVYAVTQKVPTRKHWFPHMPLSKEQTMSRHWYSCLTPFITCYILCIVCMYGYV